VWTGCIWLMIETSGSLLWLSASQGLLHHGVNFSHTFYHRLSWNLINSNVLSHCTHTDKWISNYVNIPHWQYPRTSSILEGILKRRIHVKVFWFVMPCSGVVGYQCFRSPCWHLHPEDLDLTSIFTAVKTSNFTWEKNAGWNYIQALYQKLRA
jgi:hypothetical protein